MFTRRSFLIQAAGLAAAAGMAGTALAGPASTRGGKRNRVVVQVSDNDPKRWNLALNNVRNLQTAMGKDNIDVEVVAYGPGINMLKLDSAVSSRIGDSVRDGVKVMACENTMHNQKLTKADMHPAIGYVGSGVIELMQKQQQGWAYLRP